ncbi:MAG: hypothetical protein K8W52_19015 [Deltaproteobacteria bacterium]|nr:hypothetical protein [Deltaproteobacteria bacterium]
MPDPQPAVGNSDLNNGVSAVTGVLGMVPGLSPIANLVNGALGIGTAVNGVGTGNNAIDEGVNGGSIAAGGLGAMGTIANMLGISTGVELGALSTVTAGATTATGGAAATTGLGAAIGGASTVGAVAGAGAAGYGYGNMFNTFTKNYGLAGQNSDGSNRTFSDMAGDHGVAAHDAVAHFFGGDNPGTASDIAGHVAGIGTVLGESVLGTAGAVLSSPFVIGEALGRGIGSLF